MKIIIKAKLNGCGLRRVAVLIALSLLCVLVGVAALGLGVAVALDLLEAVHGRSALARWCLAAAVTCCGLWALALSIGYLDQLHDIFKIRQILNDLDEFIDSMDDSGD